jgi:hypothetical protein
MRRASLIVILLVGLAIPGTPGAAASPETGGPSQVGGPTRFGVPVPRFGKVSPARLLAAKARSPIPPGASSRAAPSPSVPLEAQEFDAIAGDPTITPSDSTGALGEAHILTAVNIEYAVWDRGATDPATPVVGPEPLAALFPSLPGDAFVFDPKVVYDQYTERFVLVFLAGHGVPFTTGGERRSWILVVSIPDATATAPATWCHRKLNGDRISDGENLFADYPGVGFDAHRVYVATNQFTFSTSPLFRHAQVLALRKGPLYDCDKQPVVEVFGRSQTRDPQGTKAFTIQPAITQTETGKEPSEFMASFQSTGCGGLCGSRMTVWRARVIDGTLQLSARSVPVGNASIPPLGTQKDGSPICSPLADCWDTSDLRLTTAFYDADRQRLYTAHAVQLDLSPGDGYLESAIRWYEFDPAPFGSLSLKRKASMGASRRDAAWPAVGTDGSGNLFVSYSRAGAPAPTAEYLSAVASTVEPGTTVEEVAVLKEGEAKYRVLTGEPQRWGDYSAVGRDPADPGLVASVNQYAKDDGAPPTRLWQQVVHVLSFG